MGSLKLTETLGRNCSKLWLLENASLLGKVAVMWKRGGTNCETLSQNVAHNLMPSNTECLTSLNLVPWWFCTEIFFSYYHSTPLSTVFPSEYFKLMWIHFSSPCIGPTCKIHVFMDQNVGVTKLLRTFKGNKKNTFFLSKLKFWWVHSN